jgi:hypothetical protein
MRRWTEAMHRTFRIGMIVGIFAMGMTITLAMIFLV